MKKNDLKNIAKNAFISYFGDNYKDLIEERIKNLYDVIFYESKKPATLPINDLPSFLNYYGLSDYEEVIINKKIPFSKYIIEHNEQGMMPFIEKEKLYTVIYIPDPSHNHQVNDCVLIHELLHAIFENLITTKNGIILKGGFDTMLLSGKNNDIRNYECLNEILHQRVAEDVTEYMHNNKIYILDNKDDDKISNYISDRCEVVEEFYKVYRYDIYDVMLFGNTEEFINKIGIKKFDLFNQWITQFYTSFPTIETRKRCKESKEYLKMINEGLNLLDFKENDLDIIK